MKYHSSGQVAICHTFTLTARRQHLKKPFLYLFTTIISLNFSLPHTDVRSHEGFVPLCFEIGYRLGATRSIETITTTHFSGG